MKPRRAAGAALAAALITLAASTHVGPRSGSLVRPALQAEGEAEPIAQAALSPEPATVVAEPAEGAAAAAAFEPERCAPEPPLEEGTLSLPMALVLLAGERPGLTGSGSIGTPTRGSVWAAAELLESEDIERAGGYPWATERTVRSIERAVREVRRCFPGSPRLVVGDLGRRRGGWLRPHRSHQSGLDADLGYFYRGPSTWYQRATAATLDAPRTWALVRALIEGGNVDTIFIDASVQALLRAYLATLPEDQRPGEGVFATPARRDALIRHTWGHATHLHVRFRDPDAERLGERIRRVTQPAGRRRF